MSRNPTEEAFAQTYGIGDVRYEEFETFMHAITLGITSARGLDYTERVEDQESRELEREDRSGALQISAIQALAEITILGDTAAGAARLDRALRDHPAARRDNETGRGTLGRRRKSGPTTMKLTPARLATRRRRRRITET
jgi:hypothetical protein